MDTSDLDILLNRHFAGKVVRKDLTKLIKEGANVPVYVLEYLLGMYCASDDEEIIRDGMQTVKTILAENYVRPDEAEMVKSKIKDGVQIMKDFMASGSFARGRDAIQASASMVFVGNINQPVDTLVKTSHLLAPFPESMIDSAFFDRFHAYIPGWEVPKMRPEFFTNQYGLITDYLAEFMREMRKRNLSDAIDRYFKLSRDLNQRDTIAVGRTVSGLLKLLYPDGEYDKAAVRRCLEYALEARRRVKEQIKKIGGMEFFDVHFSYIDQETREEKFVSVPEQGGDKLIPDGPLNPGVLHTVATGGGGHLGLYRLETQTTAGNGKFNLSGLGSSSAAKESAKVAFDSGAKRILLPMASVGDIPSIPEELFAKFQTSFYADPVDAVFKALGVE